MLQGIGRHCYAQHESEGPQDERDYCDRSRKGQTAQSETRSIHGVTLLSPEIARRRSPAKQPHMGGREDLRAVELKFGWFHSRSEVAAFKAAKTERHLL